MDEIGITADFAEEHGYEDVARVLRAWAENPNMTAQCLTSYINFESNLERMRQQPGLIGGRPFGLNVEAFRRAMEENNANLVAWDGITEESIRMIRNESILRSFRSNNGI